MRGADAGSNCISEEVQTEIMSAVVCSRKGTDHPVGPRCSDPSTAARHF